MNSKTAASAAAAAAEVDIDAKQQAELECGSRAAPVDPGAGVGVRGCAPRARGCGHAYELQQVAGVGTRGVSICTDI